MNLEKQSAISKDLMEIAKKHKITILIAKSPYRDKMQPNPDTIIIDYMTGLVKRKDETSI